MRVEHKQASAVDFKYNPTSVKILIDNELLEEIMFIAKNVDTEVSGMGDVEITDEGFRVTKLRFFPQECTSSETEIKPEALEKLSADAIANGEDLTKMRLWWHSHAKMGCFWSGQDDTCIESLLSGYDDYNMSIVVNHKGELLARLDFLYPFPITINFVPVIVTSPSLGEEKKEQLKRMITANVNEKKYTYQSKVTKYDEWEKKEPYLSADYDKDLGGHVRRSDKAVWDWVAGEFLPKEDWLEKKKLRTQSCGYGT